MTSRYIIDEVRAEIDLQGSYKVSIRFLWMTVLGLFIFWRGLVGTSSQVIATAGVFFVLCASYGQVITIRRILTSAERHD